MKDMRLWVDIETTGLEVDKGGILELGLVLTDKFGNIEAAAEWLINPWPGEDIDFIKSHCNDLVRDMHTKSGLFEDLDSAIMDNSVNTYGRAENFALKWMTSEGIPSSALPMCGSSVHFDRAWLAKYLPAVEQQFTYRNIDISTLRELCKDLNPAVAEAMTKLHKKEEHRAIPDLEDSIDLYKFFIDNFLFVA